MQKAWGIVRTWGLLLALMVLQACGSSPSALVGTDIAGAQFAQGFSLIDHTGKPRTLDDFKGKAVAVFFGYTHCPDVCPTTLADLAKAMKELGEQANDVQVLFVTVDPERDTQAVLAKFVPSFDQRFIGLYGDANQTEAVLKTFNIFAAKQTEAGKSGYVIDHSAGVYVYDPAGHVRVYAKYGQKPQELAQDIRYVLSHPLTK